MIDLTVTRHYAWTIIWLALLTVGLTGHAYADPKTDQIVLKNGDHITGEVKELEKGLLEVSTDDFGTIHIEWDKVASVKTTKVFMVETVTGVLRYGALGTADPGQLAILGLNDPVRLDLWAVVRLAPIEATFLGRLQGSLNAGGSYTKSSGVGQFTISSELRARREKYEWIVDYDSTTTVQTGEPNSGRYSGQYTYVRLLGDRWLVPVFGRVESNPDLGYDLRGTTGMAIGRNVVQTNRELLQVGAGPSINREVPVDIESVTNVEAMAIVSYSHFTYDYPKTSLSVTTTVLPSLSDPGRVRLRFDSSLTRAIFTNDFSTSISLYDDYDNRPPAADAKTNDVGLSFSVGWSF